MRVARYYGCEKKKKKNSIEHRWVKRRMCIDNQKETLEKKADAEQWPSPPWEEQQVRQPELNWQLAAARLLLRRSKFFGLQSARIRSLTSSFIVRPRHRTHAHTQSQSHVLCSSPVASSLWTLAGYLGRPPSTLLFSCDISLFNSLLFS